MRARDLVQVWILKGRNDELYRSMWVKAMDEMLTRLMGFADVDQLQYVGDITGCALNSMSAWRQLWQINAENIYKPSVNHHSAKAWHYRAITGPPQHYRLTPFCACGRGIFTQHMEHLTCFIAGNLALGVANGAVEGVKAAQYLGVAKNLTRTCFEMYSKMPTGECSSYHVKLCMLAESIGCLPSAGACMFTKGCSVKELVA